MLTSPSGFSDWDIQQPLRRGIGRRLRATADELRLCQDRRQLRLMPSPA